jgi:hypothetical protein
VHFLSRAVFVCARWQGRDRSSLTNVSITEKEYRRIDCSHSDELRRAHPSTSPSFRAPARSDSGATIAFAQLVQNHDSFIISERIVLRDRFTLLVGTDGSLLFSRLSRFLLEPFLTNSVFGRVFEGVK